jgi:hypothetical protein
MATRYFCDRCNTQTPQDQLKPVIFPDAKNYREGVHVVEEFELCVLCWTTVRQAVNAAQGSDATKS